MKNIKIVVPVMICLALSLYIIGCGSVTGGGGGGGTTSNKSGKVVDPYISTCEVFTDVDGDGVYNPAITGEMLATTDALGAFTFSDAPPLGCTIEMRTMGTHLGVSYEVVLKKYVDGSGTLNLSPFTAMQVRGVSADAIADLLSTYASITVDPALLGDDPMNGLDDISTLSGNDAIAKIRGAICTYSITRILNAASSANSYLDKASVEAYSGQLTAMGTAVRAGLSDTMLTLINASMDAASTITVGGTVTVEMSLPNTTADDIAKSAFIVTKAIVDKRIANGGDYTVPATFEETNAGIFGQSIGMRIYLNEHYNDICSGVVHVYLPSGPSGPGWYTGTTSEAVIKDRVIGHIIDGFGNTITTNDVSGTFEGYRINLSVPGSIEPIL